MKILDKFAEVLASSKEPEGPARPPAAWYEAPESPERAILWWAVEHRGHPAFYLRALLAGDFAPGRAPVARHAASLDGAQYREGRPVTCGTCETDPDVDDLEPIERATGTRGFLAVFRSGERPWPKATDPSTCWLCGCPPRQAYLVVETPGGESRSCEKCAPYLTRKE